MAQRAVSADQVMQKVEYRKKSVKVTFAHAAYLRFVEFHSAGASFNPDYFSNFTLHTTNNTMNVDMYIIQPLKSGFRAYFEFQLRMSNTRKYQQLFSYHIDVCTMVASLKVSLLKKWYNSLKRYGNFLSNCPVTEGHYYLKGWNWDPKLLPSFLHTGEYRIRGYGYYGIYKSKNEVMVVDCDVHINII
ncbi:uncharacterized protein LOC119679617 [Teleopsis dalmanni]|uniref:uncharacterized protein LOC119679617 n=1 Tax=Teleopsis dalmanni TaxID=139649 RepID=UPI0018CF1F6B|nr:uncharacterized protein LOC119679617 [Teleopsis dalmanni]